LSRLTFFAFAVALACTSALHAEKLMLVVGPPSTKLNGPFATDFDSTGVLWFVEMPGNKLLKLDLKGDVATVAGTGAKGDSGDDGPGSAATFNGPHHLAVAPDGRVFIADTWNKPHPRLQPEDGDGPCGVRHRKEGILRRRRPGRQGGFFRHPLHRPRPPPASR